MGVRRSRYLAKLCLNSRTATPPQASRPSGLGANVPSSSSRPFKPTPVDFDFVIGNSSVKRGPRQRPKPEKEKRNSSRRPKAEAQKTSKDVKSSAPKRKSQSTSAPKVPKDRPGRDELEGYPTQASTPTETPSPDKNPSGSISVLVQGRAAGQDITVKDARSLDGDNEGDYDPDHPDALPPSADVGEEPVLALQIDEDEDCEEDRADPPVEGKHRDSRTTSDGGDPFLELVAPITRADLTMDPVSSGSQPHAAPTEDDIQLANDPGHPEQGAPQISPMDDAEPPLSLEQTSDYEGEQPSGLQEPQGLDATAFEGLNASSHAEVLRPTSTVEIQEDVAEDRTPARCYSPISTPEASPISPSPDCSPTEALDADGRRTPLQSEPVQSCEFNTALLPTAEAASAEKKSASISAPSPPAPSQESASGPEKAVSKAKTPRPRKPPLPYDALRAQVGTKSTVARSNELDYLGLDPSLVERGEIKSYQECFGNFVDVFSWSQCSNDVAQKERYLREALQIFTQLGFFFKSREHVLGILKPQLHPWSLPGWFWSFDFAIFTFGTPWNVCCYSK